MDNKYELLQINTDGGSRGNPGPAGIGVFASDNGQEIFSISERIGETTNNVAEYTAVIKALEYVVNNKIVTDKIKFVLDSELIVKQITGKYKVKLPHLQELKRQVVELVKKGREEKIINLMTFTHVLRDKNKDADILVNKALDN
jgi:ribonuclease HI